MTNIFALIAADPNVDPTFRRLVTPECAIRGSERWREIRDEESGPDEVDDDQDD